MSAWTEEVGKLRTPSLAERLGAQPSNVASKCQVSGATARVGAGARSAAKTGAEVARPTPRRIARANFRIRAPHQSHRRRFAEAVSELPPLTPSTRHAIVNP